MKKTVIVLILASLLLCGCSEQNAESTSSAVSSESVSEESGQLTCADIAQKILTFAEFPSMGVVEDENMLQSIMDFSTPDIAEYSVYQHLLSVHLQEVIVIRSNDTAATLETLKARKQTLIDQIAFYPEQKEAAEGTVVGSKGDICYLITHEQASDIEKKLLEIL